MLIDVTPEEFRILERAIGVLIVETLKTERDASPTEQQTEGDQKLSHYIELQKKMQRWHMPHDL